MKVLALTVLALALGACGDDSSSPDGGLDASIPDSGVIDGGAADGSTSDAGGSMCEVPDEVCPEALPVEGGACVTGLECDFSVGRGFGPWTYRCVGDEWVPDAAPCSELPGGGCAAPPLAERCRDPFAGNLASATVDVGSPGADFVAFEEGEELELVQGGQGAAMLAIQIVVGGGEEVLCGAVTIDLELDGVPAETWTSDVEFQCGATRRLFYVMPPGCPDVPSQAKLSVQVQGVGMFERMLVLRTDLGCLLGG